MTTYRMNKRKYGLKKMANQIVAGRWVQVMMRSSGAITGQPVNGGETGSAKEEENALKEALC